MKIINLLSSPRNLSTAIMYSFAQRNDTKVIDEPFYGMYLKKNPDVDHPGRDIIINNMPDTEIEIISKIFNAYQKDNVFIKNMCSHVRFIDWKFLSNVSNIIYIRNPYDMLFSYSKIVDSPTIQEIGMEDQYLQFRFLKENNHEFIVLDSSELLKNPSTVLQKLCSRLDIPFYKNMLSWEKGGIIEDGIWAKYWYDNVHNSTGFKPYTKKPKILADHLLPIYNQIEPLYREMFNYSINA